MAAPRLCSNCKKAGHNSRTCKEQKIEKVANGRGVVVVNAPAGPAKVEPVKVETVGDSGSPAFSWDIRSSVFAHIQGKRYLFCGSHRIEVGEEATYDDVPAIIEKFLD